MAEEIMDTSTVVVDRTDAFPGRMTPYIPKETCYDFQELREIYSRRDIHPFIFYVDNEKVYFKLLKDTWSQKRVDNLKRLAKDAGGCRSDLVKTWDSKATALKSVATSNNYCDRRLSYVFDKHYFLVKSAFTFGLRTVFENTVHLYQTTHVPLQLYIFPKNGIRRNYRLKKVEKVLAVDEQRYYHHIELKPNTAYKMKAGTRYVLFASQKAFFSVHVLPESTQLPFQTTDPVEEYDRVTRIRRNATAAAAYDRPPATPYMLDEEQQQQQRQQRRQQRQQQHPFQTPAPPPPAPPPPPPPLQEEPPPTYESLYPREEDSPYVNLEQQEPEPQQSEPPREQQSTCLLFTYALERQVKVVHPTFVKWYQSVNRQYGPLNYVVDQNLLNAGQFQTEPLNLKMSEDTERQPEDTIPEEMDLDQPATTTLDFNDLLQTMETRETSSVYEQLMRELDAECS